MRQLTEQHRQRISQGLRQSTKKVGAPRTRANCVCERCGVTFRPHQKDRGGRGNKFCSRRCYLADGGPLAGTRHPHWNPAGRGVTSKPGGQTYATVRVGRRWRLEHIVIAERVLGRRLKRGEVVHHINGNGLDNRKKNLLICTAAYHGLIHARMAQAWMREHLNEA